MKEYLMKSTLWRWGLLASLLLGWSCASVNYQADESNFREETDRLEAKVLDNPDDAEAWRDLGAIYFQTQAYKKAQKALFKAAKQLKNDPKTLFYVGLSFEFDGDEVAALKVYKQYAKISRLSGYRRLMKGRHDWMLREVARAHARLLVQDTLNIISVAPGAVAVFPMLYNGNNPQFSYLGRGMSEMLLIDLGKIPNLRLVERIRTQTLLNELKLAEQPFVDPSTAPRHGRLIGATRIVGGIFNVFGESQMRVDMSYWDTEAARFPQVTDKSDALDNFFRLEKALLFDLVGKMGIALTPEERNRLMHIPTRNIRAFIEFCKGLTEEDAGNFDAAGGFYQSAVSLDPNFILANEALERSEDIQASSGSIQAMSQKGLAADSRKKTVRQSGMVNNMLQTMTNNIGSGFIATGEDGRKSAEELVQSSAGAGNLPEPPPPPPQR